MKKEGKNTSEQARKCGRNQQYSKKFTSGCTFFVDKKWDQKWDKRTRWSYHQAQDEYAKTHPLYKKAVRAEKRARLQKTTDALDKK